VFLCLGVSENSCKGAKNIQASKEKKENNHVCGHNLALALVAIQMASLPFGGVGEVFNAPLSPY
jgi:hypothetical protein